MTMEAITPAYAPPEVFHRRPPTESGDVYSLAATLYALLSGRPPRWPETGTPNVADMFERLDDPIDRDPRRGRRVHGHLLAALASDADRPADGGPVPRPAERARRWAHRPPTGSRRW